MVTCAYLMEDLHANAKALSARLGICSGQHGVRLVKLLELVLGHHLVSD